MILVTFQYFPFRLHIEQCEAIEDDDVEDESDGDVSEVTDTVIPVGDTDGAYQNRMGYR